MEEKRITETTMSLEKKKFYLEILIAFFVIASFVISIRSCQISEEAENIAKNSLETSKKQFVKANKPYLEVNVVKVSGSYINVYNEDNKVVQRVTYHIKNSGNAAAKDIDYPKVGEMRVKDTPLSEKNIVKITMDKMTLGPGEMVGIMVENVQPFMDIQSAKEVVEIWKDYYSKKWVDVTISFIYRNELEPSILYKVLSTCRINKNYANLIKRKVEIISEQ